jgi:hypothetical protein
MKNEYMLDVLGRIATSASIAMNSLKYMFMPDIDEETATEIEEFVVWMIRRAIRGRARIIYVEMGERLRLGVEIDGKIYKIRAGPRLAEAWGEYEVEK